MHCWTFILISWKMVWLLKLRFNISIKTFKHIFLLSLFLKRSESGIIAVDNFNLTMALIGSHVTSLGISGAKRPTFDLIYMYLKNTKKFEKPVLSHSFYSCNLQETSFSLILFMQCSRNSINHMHFKIRGVTGHVCVTVYWQSTNITGQLDTCYTVFDKYF